MSLSPPFGAGSDAFLASLVRSSTDAILSKDLDGTITSWNKGAERIFGYTQEEAIGKPVTLLFPPDRMDEEPVILERIKRGELIEHYETVRRRKDGSFLDVSLTVSPIFDAKGNVVGASKVARDITLQKREQERWRITLASIGDGVIATDADGRITFMNRVAEQLTGWPSARAAGVPLPEVFQIVNESTRETVESPVTKVIREGVTVGLANHTVLIARDGTERPIDDSGAPIRNTAGELVGIVLVFRDASERREAELRALRLAAIVTSSDDAIIGKDLNGIVTSWNPGAERLFGYNAAEMIGRPVTRLFPPERISEEEDILARLKRGEWVDHFQTVRVRKDGRPLRVSLTISPIRNDEGTIIGASKIARDVTALHVAQRKLELHAAELEATVRERTAKLEALVAELESFSYSLSHDMRAPLRAIQGYTNAVLEEYGAKIPNAVVYLERTQSAACRMDRLVHDVLRFTRLSYQEIPLVPVDLEKLLGELIHERPEFQSPKSRITIERPLLPVQGHEALVTQCLANLLGNAVKFVTPGTLPEVTFATTAVADRVRISVRDNGIGISHEAQRQLFSPFRRLHPVNRYEGTGLGLAIVRRAAERMQGTAGVESAEGAGSTFYVELPAAHRSPQTNLA